MKFIFLGDVHGNINHCINICNTNPDATIVQVGDFGVGFIPMDILMNMPKNFKFFAGNHDCRRLCHFLPSNLGDYGEAFDRFFFVSGADSIDKPYRTEGIDWWNDEELTQTQAGWCLNQWRDSSVNVLVSHDLPQSFAEGYKSIYDKTLTRNLLQSMIDCRKPNMIIYGHHHRSQRMVYNGIKVMELGIDEPLLLEL